MWFFIDYEKAFDTIDYTLLLNRLSYYGIKDIVSGWSKSYLSNRTHYIDLLTVSILVKR